MLARILPLPGARRSAWRYWRSCTSPISSICRTKEYRWATSSPRSTAGLSADFPIALETDAQSELSGYRARQRGASDLRRYRSYAEAQAALGRLYDAVGIDPIPDELASLDIATLSSAIRRSSSDWDNNRISRLGEATPAAPPAQSTADAAPAAPAVAETPRQQSALAADNQPVAQ